MKGHSSSFTVRRAFHCQLCNVVYVVTCYKCGLLYIGETERSFETRLKEHLAGIHTNLPVARHFCSPGHSMQDLKAQILWRVKGDIVDRKHLEAWLISRVNTVISFRLNIKPHLNYCMSYCVPESFSFSDLFLLPGTLLALSVGGSGFGTGTA